MNIQLKRIIAFVLILFVGVIIGVMGTRIAFRALLAKALEKPSIVSEKFDASLKKLTLPPEQEQKVAQILKEFHDQRQNLSGISASSSEDSDRHTSRHSR